MDVPEISCLDRSSVTDKEKDNFVVSNQPQTVPLPWSSSVPVPHSLSRSPSHSHCTVTEEAVRFESIPSYEEFFTDIFLKNQLCILGPQCTESWSSRQLWVSDQGTPNFEFLERHFGDATVPVTNCEVSESDPRRKMGMTVSDFIEYWEQHISSGHPSNDEHLYLKDWHFTRDFPSYCAYSPPSLLCSDWLNEFWDVRRDNPDGMDDYRFVYMGPKNTWTAFHSDVLRSYSWSANICGRKKWIFFPPGVEEKLRDRHGQLVHDLRDPKLKDPMCYPYAEDVMPDRSIVLVQNPGEIVFVPSGWHHQVFNMEDTISINHNWVNGCSVHQTWAFLKSQTAKVKVEIADCASMDGFDSQCQKILKADSGMDYVEFYNFMATIAKHRLCALEVFCQHAASLNKQDSTPLPADCDDDDVTTKCKRIKADVYLCLWNAAVHSSAQVCVDDGQKSKQDEDDIKNNILVIGSRGNQIASSPSSPTDSATVISSAMSHPDIVYSDSCGVKEFSKLNVRGNEKSSSSQFKDSHKLMGEDVSQFSKCNRLEIQKTFGIERKTCHDLTSKLNEPQSDENLMSDPGKFSIGAVESTNHGKCPHWAHCGCRLAVFDLQRIQHILLDVTGQPEWKNILEQSRTEASEVGVGCVLLEDYSVLESRIQRCVETVVGYLS